MLSLVCDCMRKWITVSGRTGSGNFFIFIFPFEGGGRMLCPYASLVQVCLMLMLGGWLHCTSTVLIFIDVYVALQPAY